jgi:hypothetical protein
MTQFVAVTVGKARIVEGGAECDLTLTAVWAFTVLIVASVLVGVLGNYWVLNLKNGLAG